MVEIILLTSCMPLRQSKPLEPEWLVIDCSVCYQVLSNFISNYLVPCLVAFFQQLYQDTFGCI